jgi:EAL domain-containing protein (putative c-di-GMP-specific phosphodiesterase class I)/GGDEF domain-containing protein
MSTMELHPLSATEDARLAALRNLHLLDTGPAKAFDRITRMAGRLLRVPIASVSLIDEERQYFKSRLGFDLVEAPRAQSPCNWTIAAGVPCTIPDMREDPRFEHTPMVLHGGIRAYAGAPLVTRTGYSLGTLCVMDTAARSFNADEIEVLTDLADMVMAQIELQNSIGRIHPASGLANEYQLLDDLDDLAAAQPGVAGTALVVELMTARQMRQGIRVFGASFAEHLIHSATGTIRRALASSSRLYHIGTTRCVVLLDALETCWQEAARRLHLHLREPMDCGGVPIRAQAAVGAYAFIPGEVKSRDVLRRLYSAADDARGARMPTALYDEGQDRLHARRFQLLVSLAAALQAPGQLSLVFQPRVDLDGRPLGAEALLRWRDPQHGEVSPAEFVPLAEETGLIGTLTQWVLDRALAQAARWRRAGCDLKLSINVSAPNLEEDDFAQGVARLLARHDVPPSAIELEVTEGVLARDDGRVIEQLSALREMGVDIAIDDFGTGYSSLAYLHKLPASVLKIDRVFVRDLAANARDGKLVRAIIAMAHDLGYRVVAEGVESLTCAAMLKAWDCDEAQGYYFSRPLSATALEDWLAARADSGRALAAAPSRALT